jgi:hypothetical protein
VLSSLVLLSIVVRLQLAVPSLPIYACTQLPGAYLLLSTCKLRSVPSCFVLCCCLSAADTQLPPGILWLCPHSPRYRRQSLNFLQTSPSISQLLLMYQPRTHHSSLHLDKLSPSLVSHHRVLAATLTTCPRVFSTQSMCWTRCCVMWARPLTRTATA